MNAPMNNRSYENVANSIVEYSIKPTVLYPETNNDKIAIGRHDLMSTVFINLNSHKTINSENVLIGMLSTLLSDEISAKEKKECLENEYGLPISVELEKEVAAMCNLSDIVEERGIQQGKSLMIYQLVMSGKLTLKEGSEELNISEAQLKENMEAANFTFPVK